MNINKKLILMSSLFLLSSLTIPLVKLSGLHSENKKAGNSNHQQQTAKLIDPIAESRTVTQFKSIKQQSQQNIFKSLKKAQKYANIDIHLHPTRKTAGLRNFFYQVNYAYFNQDHDKVVASKSIGFNDSADTKITVGVQLMNTITVRVRRSVFQKPEHLQLINSADLNLDYALVAPQSISYNIAASGTVTNTKINFMRSYRFRSTSGRDATTTHSDKIGVFNVFNSNKWFFGTTWGNILFSAIMMVSLVIASILPQFVTAKGYIRGKAFLRSRIFSLDDPFSYMPSSTEYDAMIGAMKQERELQIKAIESGHPFIKLGGDLEENTFRHPMIQDTERNRRSNAGWFTPRRNVPRMANSDFAGDLASTRDINISLESLHNPSGELEKKVRGEIHKRSVIKWNDSVASQSVRDNYPIRGSATLLNDTNFNQRSDWSTPRRNVPRMAHSDVAGDLASARDININPESLHNPSGEFEKNVQEVVFRHKRNVQKWNVSAEAQSVRDNYPLRGSVSSSSDTNFNQRTVANNLPKKRLGEIWEVDENNLQKICFQWEDDQFHGKYISAENIHLMDIWIQDNT